MPEAAGGRERSQQLEPALVGRRFERVSIDDPRLVRPYEPAEVAAELEGEHVAAVERRGKYLVVRFESGRVLLIHLRMTGSLLSAASGSLPDDPHRRAVVKLDDGSDVAYRDVRRFGTWLLLEPGEAEPYPRRAGGRTSRSTRSSRPRALGERLAGPPHLAQGGAPRPRTLAGMGNIYADEALWRARLNPLRPASGLDRNELRRSTGHPRSARARPRPSGIDARDYRLPDGSGGSMQNEFASTGAATNRATAAGR
jgi:formamidopyrimidine-DNA glycosylase